MNVSFCDTAPALFGCASYVPPLMKYLESRGIKLEFGYNLIKVDGPKHKATFKVAKEQADPEIVEHKFDMLRVGPP